MLTRTKQDWEDRIRAEYGEETINDLVLKFRHGMVNLEPGFQRRSVWRLGDRRRLIQSILSQYPLPSIFLYRRHARGKLVYDVIDGKQRLESILMFARVGRFKHDAFALRCELDKDDGIGWYDWRDICRHYPEVKARFSSYKLQTIEIEGELADIVELFVRINSTGKPLTSGERRHARFYDSRFLREAEHLVRRFRGFFASNRILSDFQLERMKGTELVAELLMSIHKGGIINKKTALDRAIGNESINAHTLGAIVREFTATVSLIKRVFPNLRQTRFRQVVDFYTLFLLVWEMRRAGLALNDSRRTRIAAQVLQQFAAGVDDVAERLRHGRGPRRSQQLFTDYLMTVRDATDSAASRQRRRDIMAGLLWSIFEYKDAKRCFTPEQRRILWNSADEPTCIRCGGKLNWEGFTVDHVRAWSRGGKTHLKNAQLLCRRCNSKKGAR